MHFPASITNSKNKAKPGSDVTPTDKETLNFDDDTSIGEDSCYLLTRMRCWTRKLFTVNLHSCKRTELSAWMKNSKRLLTVNLTLSSLSVEPPDWLETFSGFLFCLFVVFPVCLCVCFLMVCLLVFLYFFIYLYIMDEKCVLIVSDNS